MEWTSFAYGVMSILLLVLILWSFGLFHIGPLAPGAAITRNTISGDMPEKCKVPAGQDLTSWKEHLGHHAETRECLAYYT